MKALKEIPRHLWPESTDNSRVIKALSNDKFLVQVIRDRSFIRISVNRVKYSLIKGKPIWLDGITWDELQEIKNGIGYADKWCVECYPPEDKVVNVAPMRHLWILDEAPEYGWDKY